MLRHKTPPNKLPTPDRQASILLALCDVQHAEGFQVWVDAGVIRIDRRRPLYEKPVGSKITWERAEELSRSKTARREMIRRMAV